MDFPKRRHRGIGFARWIVFVCLIQALLAVTSNAATTLVIFVTPPYATNVPAQATNIAVVHGVFGYSVVRNDGIAVKFGEAPRDQPTNQYVQVLTNNPPFLSLLSLEVGSLALMADHRVYENSYPIGVTNVVAIYTANNGYYYALNSNGNVYSWNTPEGGYYSDPIASTFSNIVALSLQFQSQYLALKNDGTVIQWNSSIPGPPAGLSNVVGIVAGYGWGLALRNDGTLTNWGDGDYVTNVPPGLSNVIAISASDGYATAALALKSDGTVAMWGSGFYTSNYQGLTNVTAIGESFAVVDSDFPHQIVATNLTFTNGSFSLQVPSLSEKIYCLEYTTSLSNPVWTHLPLVAGNGEMLTLTDTNAADSQRFYRVRKWQ